MNDTAIKVEGLSKRYRIRHGAGYRTLRESLADAATSPILSRPRQELGSGAMFLANYRIFACASTRMSCQVVFCSG